MSSLKNESTNAVILSASGLAKTYGKGSTAVDVLKEIDLQVSASEKVAIVGSSGSGKSTLLHLLGGLDTPSAGTVILAGENLHNLSINKLDQLRNQSLGFIYQFHHLLDEFSAVENVALPLRIRGLSNEESMERANKMLHAHTAVCTQHYPSIHVIGISSIIKFKLQIYTPKICCINNLLFYWGP